MFKQKLTYDNMSHIEQYADKVAYSLTADLTSVDSYGHKTWFDIEEHGVWYVMACRHHHGRGLRHFIVWTLLTLAYRLGNCAPASSAPASRTTRHA